jgi:uncharacterized membrane protein
MASMTGTVLVRISDKIEVEESARSEFRQSAMVTKRKNWHVSHIVERTFGQRVADSVAATMGSWTFIVIQSVVLVIWIVVNVIAWVSHWDPYPFILLNLALSFQAAYAAPFIMISQNRQAERDRHQADEDYRTNVEAEQRIEDLQRQLAAIEMNVLNRILEILEKRLPDPAVRSS